MERVAGNAGNAGNAESSSPTKRDREKPAAESKDDKKWSDAKEATKTAKLQFGRLESVNRISWFIWSTIVRTFVFENAEEWCRRFHEDKSWFSPKTGSVDSQATQEYYLGLLLAHVPGFRATYQFYQVDLRYATEPFWAWEEGNPLPLLENLDIIVYYFAFYDRPTLTKASLITLSLMLHYTNVDPDGRPDLLALISLNCMWLNERWVELHHSRQVQGVSWNKDLTIDDFKRFSCLTSARTTASAGAKADLRAKARRGMSQLKQLHRSIRTGKRNQRTRELEAAFQKDQLEKAARGDMHEFADAPIKIEVGYDIATNPTHRCSLAACKKWLEKSGSSVDPLMNTKSLADLLEMCTTHDGIDLALAKQNKKDLGGTARLLKTDLVMLLREAGYEDPETDVDEDDENDEKEHGD